MIVYYYKLWLRKRFEIFDGYGTVGNEIALDDLYDVHDILYGVNKWQLSREEPLLYLSYSTLIPFNEKAVDDYLNEGFGVFPRTDNNAHYFEYTFHEVNVDELINILLTLEKDCRKVDTFKISSSEDITKYLDVFNVKPWKKIVYLPWYDLNKEERFEGDEEFISLININTKLQHW